MLAKSTTRVLRSEGGESEERLRVFVSEGSASDLFWLEMVFKGSRLAYTIEVATDGPAAKEYLEQHAHSSRPDLIFPDLIFLDAFDVLEQLPAAPDKCFVLTHSVDNDRQEMFRRRFGIPPHRLIEKPFTNQKLFDCLAAADLTDRFSPR